MTRTWPTVKPRAVDPVVLIDNTLAIAMGAYYAVAIAGAIIYYPL